MRLLKELCHENNMVIIAENGKDLQENVNIMDTELKKINMKLNIGKTTTIGKTE